jgi:hypothetical protein
VSAKSLDGQGDQVIRLFDTGGSQEIELVSPHMRSDVWERVRGVAEDLLRRRGWNVAADLLSRTPFELCDGTNSFADEFLVLHALLPAESYVEFADRRRDPSFLVEFRYIAQVLSETSHPVRFIVVDLDVNDSQLVVSSPSLASSSDVLERALRDVERLLASRQPASGIDRIHTALHAYLREVAASVGLDASQADVTQAFKLLRKHHPRLQEGGPQPREVSRVLLAMATVVDALNPLRNMASLAHPAELLLEEPEAMLVINAVRTLLHYMEAKVRP